MSLEGENNLTWLQFSNFLHSTHINSYESLINVFQIVISGIAILLYEKKNRNKDKLVFFNFQFLPILLECKDINTRYTK